MSIARPSGGRMPAGSGGVDRGERVELPRRLSEIHVENPMILTLARGNYYPQEAPAARR
jgi:hypothetical protein